MGGTRTCDVSGEAAGAQHHGAFRPQSLHERRRKQTADEHAAVDRTQRQERQRRVLYKKQRNINTVARAAKKGA